MTANAQKKIKRIVFSQLPEGYDVFLFGSRAKDTASKFSDFDIAILGGKPLSLSKLASIKARLEESDLPIMVDLIDLQRTSKKFRKTVLKGAKKWQPPEKKKQKSF